MKKIILSAAIVLSSLSCMAAIVSPENARSQYKPYPDTDLPALSAAPAGYVPFHMEHYGRHGSRWLIEAKNYDIPVAELEKGERNGQLTPLGTEVLGVLRTIAADSRGRLGELTALGAKQHADIARRMGENFPELFATAGTHVDAKSTVVIRCILSMLNEVRQLNALYPQAIYTTDASEHEMPYMNFHDPEKNAIVDSARKVWFYPLREKYANDGTFLTKLFKNEKFVNDSIDKKELFNQLFEVSLNMGSHAGKYPEILTRVFTPEEIDRGWIINNAQWFLNGGNTALTQNRSAMVQRHLLENMLQSADSAVASGKPSVNLRFGHETMVLSLAVLMELADYGQEINDLEQLAEKWRAYEVFPMACNLQMVLYRPEGSTDAKDVLVKVLLNEREMPITFAKPVTGNYYRWADVYPYLLAKARSLGY